MRILIGVKITKTAFLRDWPEGIEKAFDEGAYRVRERKGSYQNIYEIMDATPLDLNEKEIKAIQNVLDFLALPFEGIIRKENEFPYEWELLE
jgi:hypothetical protein